MVGTRIWRENSKTWKIDTHTVEPGIWRETVKNMKNQKYTLYDIDYGSKNDQEKIRNLHGRT